MARLRRTPVVAAGGIVIRDGPTPLVAIAQRRKDGAWVLPKGKLKPNEQPIAAAKREATEETGYDVRVHEFLGVISYLGNNGPKIAHFWRMRAVRGPVRKLSNEIRSVEWLPLSDAIDRLSLPHEQLFLSNVGPYAVKRAQKKARIMQPAEEKPPTILDEAPAVTSPDAMQARPKPWHRDILARIANRWQAAMGRRN